MARAALAWRSSRVSSVPQRCPWWRSNCRSGVHRCTHNDGIGSTLSACPKATRWARANREGHRLPDAGHDEFREHASGAREPKMPRRSSGGPLTAPIRSTACPGRSRVTSGLSGPQSTTSVVYRFRWLPRSETVRKAPCGNWRRSGSLRRCLASWWSFGFPGSLGRQPTERRPSIGCSKSCWSSRCRCSRLWPRSCSSARGSSACGQARSSQTVRPSTATHRSR